jgi:hypothetical protein
MASSPLIWWLALVRGTVEAQRHCTARQQARLRAEAADGLGRPRRLPASCLRQPREAGFGESSEACWERSDTGIRETAHTTVLLPGKRLRSPCPVSMRVGVFRGPAGAAKNDRVQGPPAPRGIPCCGRHVPRRAQETAWERSNRAAGTSRHNPLTASIAVSSGPHSAGRGLRSSWLCSAPSKTLTSPPCEAPSCSGGKRAGTFNGRTALVMEPS